MSEAKIKAIIKRPDERYGHSTYISKSLADLQRIVEGPIQTVSLGLSNVIICNEEGKLWGLPENFKIYRPFFHDTIVGTVIVVGVEEEDFTDVSVSFEDWKRYLREWGNEP